MGPHGSLEQAIGLQDFKSEHGLRENLWLWTYLRRNVRGSVKLGIWVKSTPGMSWDRVAMTLLTDA